MATTTVSNSDFLVAEQLQGEYRLRIFNSRDEFIAWRQENRQATIVDRLTARGRRLPAVDHRSESVVEPAPDPAQALQEGIWYKAEVTALAHLDEPYRLGQLVNFKITTLDDGRRTVYVYSGSGYAARELTLDQAKVCLRSVRVAGKLQPAADQRGITSRHLYVTHH